MIVSTRKDQVNSAKIKANCERRKLNARAFRYITADAARGDDAKIIAAETGISVSEIYEYRTGLRNPNLSAWYELLRRRPDLKAHVEMITSGEATSENINNLIRFFQAGGIGKGEP